jgi:biopolymer transport protein ExbD
MIGAGDGPPASMDQVRKAIADGLKAGRRKVILQADGDVPHGSVLKLAAAVSELEGITLHIGVQEPQ